MNTKEILSSKKTERWLLVGIVVVFLISLFLSSVNPNNIRNVDENLTKNLITDYTTQKITVESQSYNVLIADDNRKRLTGLSYRTELPTGIDGMLFVYPEPGDYGIWMKDMNFSIDILWLDTDFNVVHRELNVSPDTFPESFTSPVPALYVLELPS